MSAVRAARRSRRRLRWCSSTEGEAVIAVADAYDGREGAWRTGETACKAGRNLAGRRTRGHSQANRDRVRAIFDFHVCADCRSLLFFFHHVGQRHTAPSFYRLLVERQDVWQAMEGIKETHCVRLQVSLLVQLPAHICSIVAHISSPDSKQSHGLTGWKRPQSRPQ